MSCNLNNPEDRKKLAETIKSDIDKWCSDKYNTGHREHLGASVMGEICDRKLWYGFRWIKKVIHDGRIQRLFQVGHNAEPRFAEYLRGIGFNVVLTDNNDKQYRITGCNGHYGGSLDGIGYYKQMQYLLEFKTNGTGTGYNGVAAKGIIETKPKHFKQMCQYGKHYGIRYGLYLIENKNDSDITIEIVPLDWNIGTELEKRAQDIISAKIPPAKIAENPAYFECKYCDFVDICHNGAKVEINCRSCRNATAVENAEWKCNLYGIIPKEFIKIGCPQHISINGET
jgi:hypothetical protein